MLYWLCSWHNICVLGNCHWLLFDYNKSETEQQIMMLIANKFSLKWLKLHVSRSQYHTNNYNEREKNKKTKWMTLITSGDEWGHVNNSQLLTLVNFCEDMAIFIIVGGNHSGIDDLTHLSWANRIVSWDVGWLRGYCGWRIFYSSAGRGSRLVTEESSDDAIGDFNNVVLVFINDADISRALRAPHIGKIGDLG